ncbi:two-component sensor histidine kinase [Amycolatopsis antarctica]|uniref:Two-component sensor histidine kinase n=1 Tax=Amycolatopsis antarctica TaxID=1854586 RepID=A0A263D1E4_9PSEU|nr:sensor histidine kinase [Amycolatopsis antarctica]OZM72171.1 two-component sensor histidine kinase [Amycolatopsis antarctica]
MSPGNPANDRARAVLWPASSRWEPAVRFAERYLAFALLALATVIAATDGDGAPFDGTLLLVAAAALWLLVFDTLLPERVRTSAIVIAVSFVGTLTFASLLMVRDLPFLVFMIGSFFHALHLRPEPLMWFGLAATSALINSLGDEGPVRALTDWTYPFLTIVAVQTLAIGAGARMSVHLLAKSEQQRRTVVDLEAALEENAGLHRQLLAQAREAGALDERQRLSLEIHDTLAQGFTGIITQLEAAAQAPGDTDGGRERIGKALTLARENLAEARRSVRALSPEALASSTLPQALDGVVGRWSDLSGVPAGLTVTGTPQRLHPEIEATLLRVTQEALTNVTKHATAGRVGLTLSYMEDLVTLDVRDDGVGFRTDSLSGNGNPYSGFGLAGMRHRVHRLAGRLEIESEPDAGTAISASVPAIGSGERA